MALQSMCRAFKRMPPELRKRCMKLLRDAADHLHRRDWHDLDEEAHKRANKEAGEHGRALDAVIGAFEAHGYEDEDEDD